MRDCEQVDIQDLENSFMFNTGFQSSSAIAKQMEYAVGTLSIYPDFLADLRKELDGKVCTECVRVEAFTVIIRMVLHLLCVDYDPQAIHVWIIVDVFLEDICRKTSERERALS